MTELWIRTQDRRRLIMVTGIEYQKINEDNYAVIGYTVNNLPIELGNGYSIDIALYILHEIQEQLESYSVYEKENKKEMVVSNGAMVYEMPELDSIIE